MPWNLWKSSKFGKKGSDVHMHYGWQPGCFLIKLLQFIQRCAALCSLQDFSSLGHSIQCSLYRHTRANLINKSASPRCSVGEDGPFLIIPRKWSSSLAHQLHPQSLEAPPFDNGIPMVARASTVPTQVIRGCPVHKNCENNHKIHIFSFL